jgi:hypothetical protein
MEWNHEEAMQKSSRWALGRLGGLVPSEAKRRANRENGHKGGLVTSRKKSYLATQRSTPTTGKKRKEEVSALTLIRARFGYHAIGLGYGGIRYSALVHC